MSRSNYRRTRNRKIERRGPQAETTTSRREPKSKNRIRRTTPPSGVSTVTPDSLESLVPLAVSSFRAHVELVESRDWPNAESRAREAGFEVRKTSVALTLAVVQILEDAGLLQVERFEHSLPEVRPSAGRGV